jgi:hypothetical protein
VSYGKYFDGRLGRVLFHYLVRLTRSGGTLREPSWPKYAQAKGISEVIATDDVEVYKGPIRAVQTPIVEVASMEEKKEVLELLAEELIVEREALVPT